MNVNGIEIVEMSRETAFWKLEALAAQVVGAPGETKRIARQVGRAIPGRFITVDAAADMLVDLEPSVDRKKAARAIKEGRREAYTVLVDPDELGRRYEWEEALRKGRLQREVRKALDEEEAADRPMLADSVLDFAELMDRPPLTPLVEGVLNLDTVALLYAPPATYKTFLALWLAACVATGHTWAGRPVERGSVLYVAAEGVAGIQKRVAALSWHLNGAKPIHDLFVYPAPINLTSDSDVDELVAFATVRGFRFIVFDTLVKVAGGAEENDNTAMTRVTNAAERVKRATTGSTVLFIHHAGKNGDMRGASALLGNVDTVLKLDGEAGALTLTAVKQKDAEGGEILRLRTKAIPEHDTLVLEPVAPGEAQPSGVQAARVEESLAHFARAFSETGATRTQFVDALVEWGVGGRSTVYSYVNELVKTGRLLVTGTASRTRLTLPAERTTFDL
ncbi:AAA family ATPase [Microbacterium sp. Leaf179]|uniref:AAA family ATPase n=1 Tax=Microbacterium sp. Leaf179 TaxID=1736288 RepID=UPI0006FA3713|nr:AAA family ATPase [Microbacterium sp. Leaf179]KQR86512.1 hypothetical protein ASF96_09105 [Microbacterium sp. Leaf179]